MATTTPVLGLIKPSTSEYQAVSVLNTNMNTIDAQFASTVATATFFPTDNWTYGSVIGDTISIQRVGKFCRATGKVKKTSGYASGVTTQIATAPFGFRPSAALTAVTYTAVSYNGGGYRGPTFRVVVALTGEITAQEMPDSDPSAPDHNVNTWLYIEVCWLTD